MARKEKVPVLTELALWLRREKNTLGKQVN